MTRDDSSASALSKEDDHETHQRKNVPEIQGLVRKIYLVEMSRAEVLKEEAYRATVVLTPLIFIVVMAWAAGMLN